MAEQQTDVIKTLKDLVSVLRDHEIMVSEAYLFGSYADKKNSRYSDIDVALISDSFTGVRYVDIKKIGRIVRKIDYRIEAHPFSINDKGESMFLDEIIRTGVRVA
jgi:predicted nucleotidyltransferase